MIISLLLPLSNVIKALVQEKETKMREGMLMMALRGDALWVTWILNFMALFLPLSILLTISSNQLFQYSSSQYIFFYFMTFFISTTSYGVLVSSFFSKSRTASIMGCLVYFMGFFIYIGIYQVTRPFSLELSFRLPFPLAILLSFPLFFPFSFLLSFLCPSLRCMNPNSSCTTHTTQGNPSHSQIMAAMLHPACAFTFGTQAFTEYEGARVGVTSKTWNVSNVNNVTFQVNASSCRHTLLTHPVNIPHLLHSHPSYIPPLSCPVLSCSIHMSPPLGLPQHDACRRDLDGCLGLVSLPSVTLRIRHPQTLVLRVHARVLDGVFRDQEEPHCR